MEVDLVLYILILFFRLLTVWQLGEAVNNIHTPNLKGMAALGFATYIGYIVYVMAAGIPPNPEAVARVIAFLMITTAMNKELKKRK